MFKEDRRVKLLTLWAMAFALFMAMLDNTVINVALPQIQLHFNSGVSGLQWIIDAYTLVFASFMLSGGTLGDIYGRKRLFLIGLVVFTGGSLLAGLSTTLSMLIAARALQGLGAAALMPGTLSILTNTFPDPRERAQAIGIWAGVSGIALAAGPIIGGGLVDTLGWQSIFFLNVPIGVVAFIVATMVVRESKNPEGRHLDLPGQILAIIGLGSLTYALIEANAKGWTSPLILSLFGIAAVGLSLFVWVESRSTSPMLQLKFFRNRTFAAANLDAAIVSFGMFGIIFFLSLFFQNVQGYSAFEAGVRQLPATLAIIVTAPLAGQIAGRIGSRVPMTVGMTLMGTSLLLMTTIDAGDAYMSIWPFLTMMGIGMGLVMTPMTAAVMSSVPPARAGMASATSSANREVGGVFGIAFLGAIVTHFFTSELTSSLAKIPLPDGVRAQVLAIASRGAREQSGAGQLPAKVVQQLHVAVDNAFVHGMHIGLTVAGLTVLGGAIVAFLFVKHGAPVVVHEGLPQPQPELEPQAGLETQRETPCDDEPQLCPEPVID